MKELRLFVLKCMADELERPSHNENCQGVNPQMMNEYGCHKQRKRKQNCWDPQRMA